MTTSAAPALPPKAGAVAKSSFLSDLLVLIAVYQSATGASDRSVSGSLFNRGTYLRDLRDGLCDANSATIENARIWLSLNWPDGAVWPASIDKPPSDRVALYLHRAAAAADADGSAK